MTNKQRYLATKAQAKAVREYLATIGLNISHVQALEVIARGQGQRSRHLLADSPAGTPTQEDPRNHAVLTRVTYGYADGSNCKRSTSIVFRGRLRPQQLELIASRLDEGEFFVPAQVGFESLHLAFTDDGGDDHWWHKLQIPPCDEWELDGEGYVLRAGDVQQVHADWRTATDADCDNLMWRFARLSEWDPVLQEHVVMGSTWKPLLSRPEDTPVSQHDVDELVQLWQQGDELAGVPAKALAVLADKVLDAHLVPLAGRAQRLRRGIAPNAYLFAEVSCLGTQLQVQLGVRSNAGQDIAGPVVLQREVREAAHAYELGLSSVIDDLRRTARVHPAAYDKAFG